MSVSLGLMHCRMLFVRNTCTVYVEEWPPRGVGLSARRRFRKEHRHRGIRAGWRSAGVRGTLGSARGIREGPLGGRSAAAEDDGLDRDPHLGLLWMVRAEHDLVVDRSRASVRAGIRSPGGLRRRALNLVAARPGMSCWGEDIRPDAGPGGHVNGPGGYSHASHPEGGGPFVPLRPGIPGGDRRRGPALGRRGHGRGGRAGHPRRGPVPQGAAAPGRLLAGRRGRRADRHHQPGDAGRS